jgi:hypothetical protein
MSNAKQIGLACKQFAIDNNGAYPSYVVTGGSTSTTNNVTSSNQAFDNLIPTYLSTNSIFYQAKSAWTPTQLPDFTPSQISTGAPFFTAGMNEWAYVPGLYDTSTSTYPLIADGFSSGAAGTDTYTTTDTQKGGVWKGQQAVVVFVDDSAKVMKCTSATAAPFVPGSATSNLFDYSGQPGWLSTANEVVNPL